MNPAEIMQALEDATTFTAFLTGIKADLVERGWSEHNAERAVITMIQNTKGS